MILAQLSDIHANGSSERLDRLDRILDWLRPMRPDAIIISGDLAENEHRSSYRALHDRLDATGSPFYLVPGNVDEHGDMRAEFGERFDWPDGERALNCSARVGDGLRVIGLDVTVAGAHYGDAAPVLGWLAEALDGGGPPALIFQHQHPFRCGIDGKDQNMCRSSEALAAVIAGATDRVAAVTCGHVHRPMFSRFAGLPATMCPSVTRANRLRLDGREPEIADPPGLLLHHFQDGRLVSHVVMVG